MPKSISTARLASNAAEVTTLAWLIKVSRTDGFVLGVTSHDQPLTVGGITYAAGGFTPSAIDAKADMSTGSMQLQGTLTSGMITEDDLSAGLWSEARIDVYDVDWRNISDGTVQHLRGFIGDVQVSAAGIQITCMDFVEVLQKIPSGHYGRLILPTCDAELGDVRCTKDLSTFTIAGTVAVTDGSTTFTVNAAQGKPTDWFGYGQAIWASGHNIGQISEIKGSTMAGVITLRLPAGYVIQVGDTLSLVAGCDKQSGTCLSKFANLTWFRGFPNVPGPNSVSAYPDQPPAAV